MVSLVLSKTWGQGYCFNETAVARKLRTTAVDGKSYNLDFYHLDVANTGLLLLLCQRVDQ